MAATPPKPVLLLAFASELAGVTLPLLAEEVRRLRAALRPAEDAGLCEVVVRQSVTLADILNVFQAPRYHGRIALFHFAGHADAYALLLTDAQGNEKSADAKGFAAFLAEQPSLDVVFLNACSTQPQVDDLLAAGVKAVIATGAEIPDDWALAFADRFYTGLAGGAGLASAFRAAEAALRAELGEQAWPWRLFPAPDGGAMAGWRLKTVTVAPSDYLWVNVPAKPAEPLLGRDDLLDDLATPPPRRSQPRPLHRRAGGRGQDGPGGGVGARRTGKSALHGRRTVGRPGRQPRCRHDPEPVGDGSGDGPGR
jgi:hypothetical protein